MNSCTFCGRLVADAEMRTTPSGTELCRFRMASDVGWGDKKQTHWLNATIFGKRGQALVQYLTKGSQVTVVGELEPPRLYEANGEQRVSQSMIVREIALQGGGQGGGQQQGAPQQQWSGQQQQQQRQATTQQPGGQPPQAPFDDPIPF